jgi:cell division protein FtsZ
MPRPRLVAVGGGGAMPLPMMMPQQSVQPVLSAVPAAQAAQVAQVETILPGPFTAPMAEPAGEAEAQPAPRPNTAPRGGLFTEPQAKTQAAPAAPAPTHRPSLFGMVTGSFRRAQPAEPERAEPQIAPEPQPTVRAAAPEAEPVGLDIPAFLRRQSS